MSEQHYFKQGSAKDVLGLLGVSPYTFRYSDHYSLFDWGEMPDLIPQKGKALCYIANFFFQEIEKKGLFHHSLGKNPENDRELFVRPVHIPIIEQKNYDLYMDSPLNTLVPLEVLFHFGPPPKSSFPKRLEKDPEYAKELGITGPLLPKIVWENPVVEFSTKLESNTRYLTRKEAQTVSGMSSSEMEKLLSLTDQLAKILRNFFADIDLLLWNGKFEFAFTGNDHKERSFMLVDSIGPDELYLTDEKEEVPFSKEYFRQFYHKSAWAMGLSEAKKLAELRGTANWKKIVKDEWKLVPESLTPEAIQKGAAIYTTLTNALMAKQGQPAPFMGPQTIKELFYELTHSRGRWA